VLEFQGVGAEDVTMNGECHMLAFRGYGYWFFTWAPVDDRERSAGEWASLRQRFAFGDRREGWTEAKPKT